MRIKGSETDFSSGISVSDAIETILGCVEPLQPLKTPIEKANGLVLGEDIIALDDIPFADNSAMDGFAVRSADTIGSTGRSPASLLLVDEIMAGAEPGERSVPSRGACLITTGAVIPPGADAVVPKEWTRTEGGEVLVFREVRPGSHIRPAGEDVKAGTRILERGMVLGPAEIGLAASCGRESLLAVPVPRASFIVTGDELVRPSKPLRPGLVRNSNEYMLGALIERSGASGVDMGIAGDNRSEISTKMARALSADIVVSSGGVSVGEKDLVKAVLEEKGMILKFWRVSVKPGRPVLFGLIGKTPFFGLPGNPVSTFVSFELFVRPAILRLAGRKRVFRPFAKARLGLKIERRPGREEYMRGILRPTEREMAISRDEKRGGTGVGRWTVVPTGPQGSGVLSSCLGANCFIRLRPDDVMIPAGEEVDVVLLFGEESEAWGE